jgi:hypothetical protein
MGVEIISIKITIMTSIVMIHLVEKRSERFRIR